MNESEGIEKRVIRNASWLFSGKTVAGLLAALEIVLVARFLGVSEYGLLILIMAYVDVVNQFIDLRVWETATKYIAGYYAVGDNEKTCSMIKLSYIIDISTGFIAFIIVLLVSNIADNYLFKSAGIHSYVYIYALSLFIVTANTTSKSILRVFDQYKNIAFISVIRNLVKLILILFVLFIGMGIKGVLFAYVVSSCIEFLIWQTCVLKELKKKGLQIWWRARTSLISNEWREISWFLINTSLTSTLKLAGDKYIGILCIGFFSSKDSVAYYNIARSVLSFLDRISDPIREVIFPDMVKMIKINALDEFKRIIKYSTENIMKIVLPLLVLIIMLAEHIIYFIFGPEYIPAANALRIVSVGVVISKLISWFDPAMFALGKPGVRTIISFINIVVYIALLLILVPKYSFIGAAFAYLGISISRVLIAVYVTKVKLKTIRNSNLFLT